MSSSESDYVMPPQEDPEKPWKANPPSYDKAYQGEYKTHQFDYEIDSNPDYNDSEGNSSKSSSDPDYIDSEGNSSKSSSDPDYNDSEGNSTKSSSATPPTPKDSSDDTSNNGNDEDLAAAVNLDTSKKNDDEDLAAAGLAMAARNSTLARR